MQRLPMAQVVAPHWQAPLERHVPALPALHEVLPLHWQPPLTQVKFGGQLWPQAPQLAGSVCRSLHPAGVWQQVCPLLQDAPPLHEHVCGLPDLHASPRLQTLLLQEQRPVAVAQLPVVDPGLHAAFESQPQRLGGRVPPSHTNPAPWELHALLQLPQLAALLVTFFSQPSSAPVAGRLQLAKPSAHVELHVPLLQLLDITFWVPHARAQAPQWFWLVLRSTSQPLASLLSQLPHPALQDCTMQTPYRQVEVAFGRLHGVPHAPQLLRVYRSVSQPLAGLLSQLPQPAEHVGEQTPATHEVVPCAFAQVVPHAPQFDVVFSCVSHPFVSLPSQFPHPALHERMLHEPVEQVAVAFARVHCVAQAPQLARVLSGVSHPLASLLSQLPHPGLHEKILHAPVEHVAVAFTRVHGVAQAPQSSRLVSCVSQPLAPSPSQLPQPAVQVGTHVPATHEDCPCGFTQAKPQAPQLFLLVRAVSQPSEASRLQSPQPASHASEQEPRAQVAVA
jgi:hypothetical protein